MRDYGLVVEIANRLYKPTRLYDFEDLLQIGLQSALRLEKSFDPEKSKKSTFLTFCIRRDMIKFIQKHNLLFSEQQGPTQSVSDDGQLWQVLPDLNAENKEMVNMLTAGHSKTAIAKRLRLSKKEVQARLEVIGKSILGIYSGEA
jgi:RNA polymerase sigma factor (sigma-70 family)